MNISSVDKVKEAAKVLAGWNGEKDEKSRKFLSDLKDGDNYNVEFFNDFGNMYFLDLRKLKNLLDDGDKNFYAVYFSIGKYKKYKK